MQKRVQYKIFKRSKGCAQFNLILSPKNALDMRGVLLEIASTKEGEPDRVDWDNKILMLLNVVDFGKLIVGLRNGEEVKLFHDSSKRQGADGGSKKTVFLSPGKEYGFYLAAVEGDKKHSLPISTDEAVVLGTLLQESISLVLDWNEDERAEP